MRTRRKLVAIAAVIALIATMLGVAVYAAKACQSGGRASAPTRSDAATGSAAPATPEGQAALERFVPVLRYAEREEFFATSADALVEHRDSTLRRGGPGGDVIAAAAGQGERLSLRFLGARHYANGQPTGREDTISVAHDDRGWADRSKHQRQYGDVVYGRAVQASDGRRYLQYWFFYVFNDSLPCWGDTAPGSLGDHEGDWELVQIRLGAAGRLPELVTVSQHKGAETLAWRQVEKVDGRPVIYPGLGTHAGAFTPGCHWAVTDFPVRGAAPDCNNGRGRQATPTLKALDDPWATWPGRWGTIAAPCTTDRWRDPRSFIQ